MPTPTGVTPTGKRAKAPPTTRKTSLHRLRSSGPPATEAMRSFVVPSYLQRDGFTSRTVDHEGISGLLVSGTIAPGDADWCAPLGGLVGITVAEQNRTSLALLLVRTDKAVYGLTFGLGHLMIDQARIDPGFGIEFAVRCLDEERITKVRRQVMDARGRTDENSATSGEHIRGFGIEQFGEIVSQISGQIAGVPLTFTQDRNRPAHVTGSDRSIKLHLGTTPAGLLHDLQQIEQVCTRPSPLPEFEFIAQVRPLNPKSERALRLDDRLDEMLGGAEVNRLALAVPGDCRDRFEFAESFTLALAGRSQQVGELDIDDLVGAVADRPEGQRLRALRQGRIQMFADNEGADQLLSEVSDSDGVERFVRRWLGALLDYDARKGSELTRTLSRYLECSGSYDATAQALALGRSTLKYRLQRIRQIFGHDLSNPDTRFNLHLATRAWCTLLAL